MLTPLPPCRSGIADYNADFLPYLAEHFDLDVYIEGSASPDSAPTSGLRILDVAEFWSQLKPNALGYACCGMT